EWPRPYGRGSNASRSCTGAAFYPSDSTRSGKALIFSAALRGSAPLRELLTVHAETRRRREPRRYAASYGGLNRQFYPRLLRARLAFQQQEGQILLAVSASTCANVP